MKSWQMTAFAGIALVIWGIFNAYIGLRLVVPARLSGYWANAAWSALVFSWLVFPAVFILRSVRPDFPGIHSMELAAYVVFGLVTILFPLLLVRDLGWVVAWVVRLLPSGPARAEWLRVSGSAVFILSLAMFLGGLAEYARGPLVDEVDLPIKNLARGLEGYRIVQLTDLHIGVTARADRISRIVAQANGLNPDLVVFTGDLADGRARDFRDDAAPLSRLKARDGKLFVTGNHEYFYDYRGWMAEIPRLGFRVLMNSHVRIRRGKGVLAIGGIPDTSTSPRFTPRQAADPVEAMRGIPEEAVKILLSHQPNSAPAGSAAGFDFQLSGHTHGGQYFPWNLVVPRMPFARPGLREVGDMILYVSRGTGAWGPPIRLFVPGEITLFVLTRPKGG